MDNQIKEATEIFTKQEIIDLFITACEGGSNYWASALLPISEFGDPYETMLEGFLITDSEASKTHKVTPKDIHKAAHLMMTKYSHHYADVKTEDMDAITGDVFLQLCVFGDVIYG